jgi:hypothetical protein
MYEPAAVVGTLYVLKVAAASSVQPAGAVATAVVTGEVQTYQV